MRRYSAPFSPYPRDYSRPTCYSCFRPTSHCICEFITPFKAQTNLLVLQHPNEWKKFYSTSRLLNRAISNLQFLRGITFSEELLRSAIGGRKAYLLYPSKSAEDCEKVEFDSGSLVIAVDGTWIEARKIVYRNPFLKTLPAISFYSPLRSNYRIRKQPKEHCLSTLESIGHLLRLNAAKKGDSSLVASYDKLFAAFEKMVDQQISHWPKMKKVAVEGSVER